MTAWPKVPIGEVMSGFFDGPHATPPPAEDGPIYLGIKNVTEDGRLDLSEIRHIAWEDFAHWTRRVEPQPGDLVFTYEASLHRYAMIPLGFKGCLGRRTALIRPDKSKVDGRFLLYQLLGPKWRATVAQRINIGSTVDRIPLTDFPDFPIHLPPLPVQRKIASVLAAYDELIEKNARRIQILEDMAQALYRESFLEFRFPFDGEVGMASSELGQTPIGWEVAPFGRLAKEIKDGVIPEEVDPRTLYIGLEHIPRKSFTITESGHAGEVSSRKWRFRSGDILFGKLRPYFHKVGLAPTSGISSTDIIVIRPNPGMEELALQVAFSTEFVAHAVATSGGTDRPRAKWNDLAKFPVAVPPDSLRLRFAEVVRPLTELAQNLARQNAILQHARDLLLPRLVSGEIDVSDLDIDTEWLVA